MSEALSNNIVVNEILLVVMGDALIMAIVGDNLDMPNEDIIEAIEANANLRDAAPDMLEALQKIAGFDATDTEMLSHEVADIAIAKAT